MKDSLSATTQNQTLQAVVKVVAGTLTIDSLEVVRAVLPQLQNQGNVSLPFLAFHLVMGGRWKKCSFLSVRINTSL